MIAFVGPLIMSFMFTRMMGSTSDLAWNQMGSTVYMWTTDHRQPLSVDEEKKLFSALDVKRATLARY
jgi:trehalose utilization protein